MINRATLSQLARRVNDGTVEAEGILNWCKEQAEMGRGGANYFAPHMANNVMEHLRSYGLEVVMNQDSGNVRITWDAELEQQNETREAAMSTPEPIYATSTSGSFDWASGGGISSQALSPRVIYNPLRGR